MKVLQVPEVLQLPEEGCLSGGRNAVNETVLSQLFIKNCVTSTAERIFTDELTVTEQSHVTESPITTQIF